MLNGVKGLIGPLKVLRFKIYKLKNYEKKKNNKRTHFIKRTEHLPLTLTFQSYIYNVGNLY